MKKGLNALFSLIFFSATITSCKKEPDSCSGQGKGEISNVIAPATGMINQDVIFKVEFALVNGCQKYLGLSESLENGKTIVSTNISNEGCICTAVYFKVQVEYKFKRSTPGTYKLIFKSGGGGDIEKTISIQ